MNVLSGFLLLVWVFGYGVFRLGPIIHLALVGAIIFGIVWIFSEQGKS